ncbi:MAG: hypothetical protein ACK5M3_05575 [Dysgonomonas sp.]
MNTAPTPEQTQQTISLLHNRLNEKAINRNDNLPVKEGYTKAVEILESGITEWEKADLKKLTTTQGRSIAYLAVSYLNGTCTQETFCGVPIKKF